MVLLTIVIGFEIWLLKQSQNNEILQIEVNNKDLGIKVGCEWKGKIHYSKEPFLIWLGNGCSLCVCGEDNSITCQQVDCPEGGRND